MKLDKYKLKKVREELNALIKHANEAVFNYEGIEVQNLGNCSFNEDNATFKLSIKVAGSKSEELKALEIYGNLYSLDLSKIATKQGASFSLVGYNSKARSYPFEMQKLETGQIYKCSIAQAQQLFAKAVQDA